MDGLELLKTWPEWARAGAETILASPAWRMPVRLGDEAGMLRFGTMPLTDTINLEITLDDEPQVLSFADSPCYPDLHLLWQKREGLPSEILLALLEKECGDILSLLEKSMRRLLVIKGLAPAPSPDARTLEVETSAGTISFAVGLLPEVRTLLGRLDLLDPAHPSIRELTRTARVDYCSLLLTDEERTALASGDHLLVPETFAQTQRWIVDDPDDDALHLCSADARKISFGEFADETLPCIPEPRELSLVWKGQLLCSGTLSRLGVARTVQIN